MWLRWRSDPNWLNRTGRRTWLLIASSLFYTVPLSAFMLWLWYQAIRIPTDWTVIAKSALACVFADLFIKNTYESVYLIRQRGKLERAKLQAELSALKSQLDPHFVLNCLNSFTAITAGVSEEATDFAVSMADVYRYMLRIRDRELVPLTEELDFTRKYFALLSVRHQSALKLTVTPADPAPAEDPQIPPAAIQMLLENAVKHNRFSSVEPLEVRVEIHHDHVLVTNPSRPNTAPADGTGLGLQNLTERCQLLLNRPIQINKTASAFSVTVPMAASPRVLAKPLPNHPSFAA